MVLKPIICPSILSADFAQLAQESARMESCGADYLHIDVMDGHFVPNLTLGAPLVKCLRKHTKLFLDCHLMVTNPEFWIDDFAKAGADQITFHIEATNDALSLVKKIKEKGMLAGIAIKPKTSVESILHLVPLLDLVLVMTVEPGFGGQKLIKDTLEKVSILRKQFPQLNIQVDGGIDMHNIDQVASSGANVIVSGTGIFGHADPGEAISIIYKSVEKNISSTP